MKIQISLSSQYDDIFNPIEKSLTAKQKANVSHWIKESVKLGKADRRIFFLKLVRQKICDENGLKIKSIEKERKLFETKSTIDHVFTELLHAYEMNLAVIDREPLTKNIDDILDLFEKYKRDGQKRGVIPVFETDEIVKHYKDGFYWVRLHKAACELEGKAMGHCGNVPSAKQNDDVFSLRKLVKKGREEFWQSKFCTIILDHGKYLGEIRGPLNNEPDPEYMDKIVDLLCMDVFENANTNAVDYVKASWACLTDLTDEQWGKLKHHNFKLYNEITGHFNDQFEQHKDFIDRSEEIPLSNGWSLIRGNRTGRAAFGEKVAPNGSTVYGILRSGMLKNFTPVFEEGNIGVSIGIKLSRNYQSISRIDKTVLGKALSYLYPQYKFHDELFTYVYQKYTSISMQEEWTNIDQSFSWFGKFPKTLKASTINIIIDQDFDYIEAQRVILYGAGADSCNIKEIVCKYDNADPIANITRCTVDSITCNELAGKESVFKKVKAADCTFEKCIVEEFVDADEGDSLDAEESELNLNGTFFFHVKLRECEVQSDNYKARNIKVTDTKINLPQNDDCKGILDILISSKEDIEPYLKKKYIKYKKFANNIQLIGHTFDSLEEIAQYFGLSTLESYLDMETFDVESGYEQSSAEEILGKIRKYNKSLYQKLLDRMPEDYEYSITDWIGEDEEIRSLMERAINIGLSYGAEAAYHEDLAKWMDKHNIYNENDKYSLYIWLKDFIELMKLDEVEDETIEESIGPKFFENFYSSQIKEIIEIEDLEPPHYGYEGFDEEAAYMYFVENEGEL